MILPSLGRPWTHTHTYVRPSLSFVWTKRPNGNHTSRRAETNLFKHYTRFLLFTYIHHCFVPCTLSLYQDTDSFEMDPSFMDLYLYAYL